MPAIDFAYDGYAVGLSGFLGKPIPTQVVAGIPSRGGEVRFERLNFRDSQLSLRQAWLIAAGRALPNDTGWESSVRVSLDRCAILDQIFVDHVHLELASIHRPEERWPRFTARGSAIENLSIRGVPIRVALNNEIEFGVRRRFPNSLATEISSDFPVAGNVITIPDLGKLHIAALSLKRDQVRLVMLSLELNSGQDHIELASASLGGQLIQPPLESPNQPVQETEQLREMDDEEYEKVVDELRLWANNHPGPREPFLALMGRVLTPLEFLEEVEARSRIGRVFLSSLLEPTDNPNDAPHKFVRRAVEANQKE
jgi:hypothetical protein